MNKLHLLLLILVAYTPVYADSGLTFVANATARGAVCLDGSPAAYYFEKGTKQGANNWIVFLNHGGWCNDVRSCLDRTNTTLGSSRNLPNFANFMGMLNQSSTGNHDFYNWNLVQTVYCDGASYTGDVEEVDPSTNLHFRGARIFSALVDELLEKGMKYADNAILTGCSAGGLGTILNCDRFRGMLPSRTTVKCVADAGYFVNMKNISASRSFEEMFDGVVKTHGMLQNLHPLCREEMKKMKKKESLCVFPENMARHIQTPIFFVNAEYDNYQIKEGLVPFPPTGSWNSCRYDIKQCSSDQLGRIQDFGGVFQKAFHRGAGTSPSRGYFINGCFDHCQTDENSKWSRYDSPRIKGTSIAKAVGDWYFERNPFKEIGVPYPRDNSCHNSRP